ncbi:hypothetical protein [Mucilaginibacter sp. 22184]|uniref:hypothetical protein n=1 Tax=Mucilaginibacter sp. 22184 TaxID=3453887 RepID=UPI003F8681B2
MKIFNISPFQVTKYIFNQEHLAKSLIERSYESGFGYTGKKVELLNTLIITFDITYCAGENDELLLSYESHSRFNFESEGFEHDVRSIEQFLKEYYVHTEVFFQQYGFKTIQEIEKENDFVRGLESSALTAINSLREDKF